MKKITLVESLSDLIEMGPDDSNKHPVLTALDTSEAKTAILVLILNEIRAYKTSHQEARIGDIVKTTRYDTNAGFAKLSAYVELLDIPAFIESKKSNPSLPEQDYLPE